MPHTETRTSRQSSRLLGLVLKLPATAVEVLKTRQRRRAIAHLPPEQLNDIGAAETPAPVLEVKPGLVTNLMSMR